MEAVAGEVMKAQAVLVVEEEEEEVMEAVETERQVKARAAADVIIRSRGEAGSVKGMVEDAITEVIKKRGVSFNDIVYNISDLDERQISNFCCKR